MRTLRFLLQKEFRQIFRDPSIIRLIFIMPIIQLMILPWAADYEIKNIKLSVVDKDHSDYSRQLISKITSTGYFQLAVYTNSYPEALQQVVVVVPVDAHKDKTQDIAEERRDQGL